MQALAWEKTTPHPEGNWVLITWNLGFPSVLTPSGGGFCQAVLHCRRVAPASPVVCWDLYMIKSTPRFPRSFFVVLQIWVHLPYPLSPLVEHTLPGRGWEDAARAHAAQKAVVGEPRLLQLGGMKTAGCCRRRWVAKVEVGCPQFPIRQGQVSSRIRSLNVVLEGFLMVHHPRIKAGGSTCSS